MNTIHQKEAVRILKSGGVIAYPTETFYGLAADARNESAIQKIFKAKGRDEGKPISLIISSSDELDQWVERVGDTERNLIKAFWPGPLTLVFQAKKSVSSSLTAGTGKIALRVSSHPIALALAKGLASAITATSANLSGEKSCLSAVEVDAQLGKNIDGIVDGGVLRSDAKGSTIIDISGHKLKVIREGEIPSDLIINSL